MENQDKTSLTNKDVSSPTGGKKHVELSPIHDFAAKIIQPDVIPRLREYVDWQRQMRYELQSGKSLEELDDMLKVPDFAPVSINLDITTACNYRCDHCVDMDILNKRDRYEHDKLIDSIKLMADKGLKSVIVIGGGEPTLYRKFVETIEFMKDLGLQVSIVSNGAGNKRILAAAPVLEEGDWIRLSLDSGSEDVFQRMHKPRKKITLDEICEWIPKIKEVNDKFPIGFSFIITWKGATINDSKIVENIDEMVMGAERAKKYQFDYITYKPFLTRATYNNAEIVDLRQEEQHFQNIVEKIDRNLAEAQKLETDKFSVYATTNLKVLKNQSAHTYMKQPHQCHMQFFRQVLSPLGMYNCPVYRNQIHGRLGDKEVYANGENYDRVRKRTGKLIQTFDATVQCREVTCLYNHVNWWIEDLIENPEKLDELGSGVDMKTPDFFL